MTKWNSILTAVFLLISLPEACVATSKDNRPNIIVIMADDMGYADAGFTGSQDIQTPNLDQLAESGVIFTQGYVNHPFCAPSRAAFLTGRYQQRFGFEDNPAYDPANPYLGIAVEEKLFPQRLKEVGYVTGCIGKWHLGAAPSFHPNNRGFDYFYGFLGGGHDYFKIDLHKPVRSAYFQPLARNNKPAEFEGYLTTALSLEATKFIETNKANPFFLFLSYNAPHGPLQAPKEDIVRYAHIEDDKRRVYAAMVDVMDRGIGNVILELEKQGLRENTLIFFLSDNGGPISMSWNKNFGNGSSNSPFRGGKTNLYEGGIHVPFIASWPAQIPPRSTYDDPVIAIDIARTTVECAGADASVDPKMEGVDLIPYVLGKNTKVPHEYLFWRGRDGARWAVMDAGGYKYVVDQNNGKPELFDLREDISEADDIAGKEPELTLAMRSAWTRWDKKNIANRIGNYLEYFNSRENFYRNAIPKKARQVGFPGSQSQ